MVKMEQRRIGTRRLAGPAVVLALMTLLAYAYWVPRGALANADTRLALTRAIVDDHALSIDRYAVQEGLSDRSAFGGHYYTDKSPAVSLLAVPAYAVLRLVLSPSYFTPGLFFLVRYLVTAATLGLPAALFVGIFWCFLLPVLGRRRAALLALGYGLGTMAWGLSSLLFSHVLTAISLFGAFILLDAVAAGRAVPSWRRWAAAGLLVGLAICLEYPATLVGAVLAALAVHLAWRSGRARTARLAVAFVAGVLPGLAVLGVYNLAVYGNPLSQGYAHLHGAAVFQQGMRQGMEGVGLPSLAALWGITFSPYRGIFVLSPFLLLALPGLVAMWHRPRRRAAAIVCASAVAGMLLFNSSYYFWDGGVSLGPRHFSPALLFLVYPVAYAIRSSPWSRLAPWLIGLSMSIVTLACVTVLIFLPGVPNPLVDLALAHLVNGPAPNNWGMLLGLRGEWSLAPLALLEGWLAIVLLRTVSVRRSKRTRAARTAADRRTGAVEGPATPGPVGAEAIR